MHHTVYLRDTFLDNRYTKQSLKLQSQPRGMDVLKKQNIVIVASVTEIAIVEDNRKVNALKVGYEPSSVSVSPDRDVAVGGTTDNKVHIFGLDNTNLVPKLELDHLGAVTDVAYSPNGKYLVACDAYRKVILYNVPEYKVMYTSTRKMCSL